MRKIAQALFALMLTTTITAFGAEEVHLKGHGIMQNVNGLNGGFNLTYNSFHVCVDNNKIKHGDIRVSSQAAGPIDPITGIDFEADASVDGVKVFANHPGIVWVHGIAAGTITFGTSPAYGPLAGQTVIFDDVFGEFIGFISNSGRSNFLSVFENEGPLPNFCTATEAELTALVGGYSRTFIETVNTKEKDPISVITIETEPGVTIICPPVLAP